MREINERGATLGGRECGFNMLTGERWDKREAREARLGGSFGSIRTYEREVIPLVGGSVGTSSRDSGFQLSGSPNA